MAHAELAQPLPSANAAGQPSRWPLTLAVLGAVAFAMGAGFALGGEPARFAGTGLAYVPLIVLAGLLQLRQITALRILSWTWFWLLVLGIAGLALGMIYLAIVPPGTTPSAEQGARIVGPALGIAAVVLIAIVLAVTPAWSAIGRLLGAHLDRTDAAHAQGIVGLLVVSVLMVAPLAALGGKAPLLELLDSIDPSVLSMGDLEQILAQLYTVVWTIVFVLVGSAWPTRAALSAVAARLGLGRLQRRDLLILAGISVGSVALGFGLDQVNRVLLGWLGWPLTDASVITKLISVSTTPIGAVIVAVCAGVAEELIFRGLLQPRFGWFITNVAFATAHAFQYGVDGLVVVFALGAILAFVRSRWNTTAAISVHVAYDALLLLLSAFGF
jgi:membrane protease YdiL (CAAX protease family)